MNIFDRLKYELSDFIYMLKCYKTQVIACVVVFAVGIVLGCAVGGSVVETTWYIGKADYVIIIVKEGSFFKVLFSALLRAILLAVILVALSLSMKINYVKCAVPLVCGFYLGLHLIIALELYAFLGVVYFILVFLVDACICVLATIVSFCDTENFVCGKVTIKNAIHSNTRAIIILAVGVLLKIIVIFVLLRFFIIFI